MGGLFFALAALAWLLLLVDWKDLRSVLRQGGWASVAFFTVVGVLIVFAFMAPETVSHAPAVHH